MVIYMTCRCTSLKFHSLNASYLCGVLCFYILHFCLKVPHIFGLPCGHLVCMLNLLWLSLPSKEVSTAAKDNHKMLQPSRWTFEGYLRVGGLWWQNLCHCTSLVPTALPFFVLALRLLLRSWVGAADLEHVVAVLQHPPSAQPLYPAWWNSGKKSKNLLQKFDGPGAAVKPKIRNMA